jgi:hypothetical protein
MSAKGPLARLRRALHRRGVQPGCGLDLLGYHSRMLRTTEHLIPTAVAILASSCAPPVARDTRAADESAIRALDEQWSATAAKNDLDGTVTVFSDISLPILLEVRSPGPRTANCALPKRMNLGGSDLPVAANKRRSKSNRRGGHDSIRLVRNLKAAHQLKGISDRAVEGR